MKRMKKNFIVLFVVMMITFSLGSVITIPAKVNYSKREQIAKKNLKKKVQNMLKKNFHQPYCSISSSKRKEKILTCHLTCSIGDGACRLIVKVNLESGVATIVFDDVGAFIQENNGRWDDDAYEGGGYVGEYKFKINVK